MHTKILTLPLFIFSQYLYGQQYFNDTALVSAAPERAKYFYKQNRGNEAAIYEGIIHYPYPSSIEGTAYFLSENWQKGTVLFDNILYEDILMKYDQVTDKLVITSNETSTVPFTLFSSRVKEFSFSGFKFIYPGKINGEASRSEGFYQVLWAGKATALCKSSKMISETITGTTIYKKFIEKKKFYFVKNNQIHPVNNKNDIVSILKEHKKEVQSFMKDNQLNFRKAPEKTVIAAAEIYNKMEDQLP
jgi:hypothetical protein